MKNVGNYPSFFIEQKLLLKTGTMLFLLMLIASLSIAGNNTDVLGMSGVYDTIAEWTSDRNLNLLLTTIVVIVGLVRWWQVGGMAGGVQFAALFVLAVIFYNSNKIVTALYTGTF